MRTELADELSRRDFLARAGGLGLGALILGALPVAEGMAAAPAATVAAPTDATLQAFYDTMIPGRKVVRTELGNAVDPRAIAGVDPEPGAVEADALLLGQDPKIGFELLAPALLAELEARSLGRGGEFLALEWDGREAVCLEGTSFSNPTRVVWEAAAAVAFTAFCAAATIPGAIRRNAVGYRVMGHPGTAPHGYRDFSYRRKLNRGLTKDGSLP